MTKGQEQCYKRLKTDFGTLWNLFCQYIPEAKEIVSKKGIAKFGRKYAERYKSLCDDHREYVKSPCLFDEFISSFENDTYKLEFKNEIELIAKTIMLSLDNAKFLDIEPITNGIKDIVRQMILTVDFDILANNPDYRNRLNELLVFRSCFELCQINV
jgi:hypothetical protein